MLSDRVISNDNRVEFSGTPAEVIAFLKSVKTPISLLLVRTGSPRSFVSAETYLRTYSVKLGLPTDMWGMANLITDMVHGGCEFEELANAIRHAVLVVDTQTINEESDADIQRLRLKYQSKENSDTILAPGEFKGYEELIETLVSPDNTLLKESVRMDTSQFVSQYYEMNPETDVLLPTGQNLKDGMVVLIDDAELRTDLDLTKYENSPDFEKYLYEARERNRWCTVAEVETRYAPEVSFTALYEDGLKRRRTYHPTKAWLVKQDSLDNLQYDAVEEAIDMLRRKLNEREVDHEIVSIPLDQYERVFQVVRAGIARVAEVFEVGAEPEYANIAEDVTKQILGQV